MKSRGSIDPRVTMVSLLSIFTVLSYWYLAKQDPSPGSLALAHARQSDLAGTKGCNACHANESHSMDDACLACHETIQQQFSAKTGLHGHLPEGRAFTCAKCHSEHHGADFRMVNRQSFSLAGIAEPEKFDHRGLDFQLAGKHLEINCRQCHPNADIDVLPDGKTRFLGLSRNCETCHQDVHEGSFGKQCALCHGQSRPFKAVAEFKHTPAFSLEGAHQKAGCRECHRPATPWSVDVLFAMRIRNPDGRLEVRTCGACHPSPHTGNLLSAVAGATNHRPEHTCEQCHQTTDQHFFGSERTMAGARHDVTGFSLTPPHDAAKCDACHPGFGKAKQTIDDYRMTYPGRNANDCAACHVDPHRGQFRDGPSGKCDCLACHAQTAFLPALYSVQHHARTRFPLNGAHENADCNRCHRLSESSPNNANDPTSVRIFRGTPTACRACHGDPHSGQFENGPFRGGNCLVCHTQDAFRPSTFTIEQHGRTRFPLAGAHAAVGCDQCHPLAANPVGASHPSTPSRKYAGTPSACKSCHADVHAGRFDRPDLPAVVDGRRSCYRCHRLEAFNCFWQESFDHSRWTGYSLTGAHARAECGDCHRQRKVVDRFGRVTTAIPDTQCQACHQDPHVGQFGPTLQVDCSRCHMVDESFQQLVFDHQRDSRFPLDEVHVKLACSACHVSQAVPGWGHAVRYRPLGIVCGDCHDPRGPTRTPKEPPR